MNSWTKNGSLKDVIKCNSGLQGLLTAGKYHPIEKFRCQTQSKHVYDPIRDIKLHTP
jgi:hypothetical protein